MDEDRVEPKAKPELRTVVNSELVVGAEDCVKAKARFKPICCNICEGGYKAAAAQEAMVNVTT